MRPITTPISPPSMIEATPTVSEMRAPWMMRLNTSRPIMSAPMTKVVSGAFRESGAEVCSGSCGASTSANTAENTKTITITAPIAPSGCWRM